MNDTESSRPRRGSILALIVLVVLGMVAGSVAPAVDAAKSRRDRGSSRADAELRDEIERARADVNVEVVGGKPVPQGKYRFAVLVLVKTPEGTFQCGGSLIDPLFVLTAAHCVEDFDGKLFKPGQFTILVGKANQGDVGPQNRRFVTEVSQHPQWDPETFENDAAVLHLNSAVAANIAPAIRLISEEQSQFDDGGQKAVVAGWGRTRENGFTSSSLREASLNVITNSRCGQIYDELFFPAEMVCASAKGRDSCQGDSGGPLFHREVIGTTLKQKRHGKGKKRVPVYRETLIGIVSWGFGCARPAFPGVYTRISDPEIDGFIKGVVNGG